MTLTRDPSGYINAFTAVGTNLGSFIVMLIASIAWTLVSIYHVWQFQAVRPSSHPLTMLTVHFLTGAPLLPLQGRQRKGQGRALAGGHGRRHERRRPRGHRPGRHVRLRRPAAAARVMIKARIASCTHDLAADVHSAFSVSVSFLCFASLLNCSKRDMALFQPRLASLIVTMQYSTMQFP